jgi:pilus assembly protein CpaF
LAAAAGLGRAALHSQLLAGVQAAVHLVRGPEGRRRLGAVSVLQRGSDGLAEVSAALVLDAAGRLTEGPGAARLAALLQGAPA